MVEKTWPIAEKLFLNTLELARKLYQQLTQEADALKAAPKPELLDAIAANKRQLVAQLEQFNVQCGQILATEKLPNNQDGIKAYFQRAEAAKLATAETLKNWELMRVICTECKTLNEQNGASIELLSHHTKRSLDILKGKPRNPGTYGPDGTAKNDPLTHTLTFYL